MNGIQSFGQSWAMDGRLYSPSHPAPQITSKETIISLPDVSEVAQTLAENLSQEKTYIQELQRVADSLDRKVKFNLNQELGQVVVKIVDPSTDKVIKEIPSQEVQNMQLHIKETIGLLFDEIV